MHEQTRDWASEEFGGARLGDRRLEARLVLMAEKMALRPTGTVTGTFQTSAEREAAFRFLENASVSSRDVAFAAHAATLQRAQAYSFVYVPVDGSSLALTNVARSRDLGSIGARNKGAQGLIVHSAMAVSPDGTPLGMAGQTWWARLDRARRRKQHNAMAGETRHPVELIRDTHDLFATLAPDVMPWFQLDRGYDAWPVLQLAAAHEMLVTVRASHNRIVRTSKREEKQYLKDVIASAPVVGRYDLELPAGDEKARIARMEVRVQEVTVELCVGRKRREYVTMRAVRAQELGAAKPLSWILLTTAAVDSFDAARAVIDGYATRWRIEEFHRAWKRGVCNVEDTQLRNRESIIKWATILASVASRAVRLTYAARERPEAPASEEFSADELQAIGLLLPPKKKIRPKGEDSLAQVVRWVADLGGYTGKSSGGPPGATVIARGLARLESAVMVVRNLNLLRANRENEG